MVTLRPPAQCRRSQVPERDRAWGNPGRSLPFGRQATAWEVAHAAVWLLSGEASYVNAHPLVLDGGATSFGLPFRAYVEGRAKRNYTSGQKVMQRIATVRLVPIPGVFFVPAEHREVFARDRAMTTEP